MLEWKWSETAHIYPECIAHLIIFDVDTFLFLSLSLSLFTIIWNATDSVESREKKLFQPYGYRLPRILHDK